MTGIQNIVVEKLTELREEIASLSAIKCRMHHEKIRIDKSSGKPFTSEIPEALYMRVGFCTNKVRSNRIACAHTKARYLLRDAIHLLQKIDNAPKEIYQDWMSQLNRIDDSIHSIDRKKGEAEKEYAKLLDEYINTSKKELTIDMQAISAEIQQMEEQHCLYVDEVDSLRKFILSNIDSILGIMESR